jgi:hypothetical protein
MAEAFREEAVNVALSLYKPNNIPRERQTLRTRDDLEEANPRRQSKVNSTFCDPARALLDIGRSTKRPTTTVKRQIALCRAVRAN